MVDLRRQGITVDYKNDQYPKNMPYKVPQLENALNLKPEEIICSSQSHNVHHTYAA